ncbi:MAG TPA: EamA/RhaT family transporter [Bacteroidales bacterium]|nr:EamA/RhaT family transporter [Bacteroidales bacterium]
MKNNRRAAVFGAVAICISASMWGLDGIVLTPNLYNLEVGYVVFMLHLIPFAIMNVFLFREYRHVKLFTKADVGIFLLVALFGGAVGTLSIVKALFLVEFQKLSIVVLLQKTQPIFAIALAAIILKERPRKGYFLWATLAILASYFLTFGFEFPDVETNLQTIHASLFALLAAVSFGSATVFGKKILNRYSFHTATFYRYGFTTLIMFLFVLIVGRFDQLAVTTTRNWLIFFIIAFTTGSGAIYLYYYGLRKVRAMVATICELCFPLTAILLDYLINHQQLSQVQWMSAAILIFSIIMLNLRHTAPEN